MADYSEPIQFIPENLKKDKTRDEIRKLLVAAPITPPNLDMDMPQFTPEQIKVSQQLAAISRLNAFLNPDDKTPDLQLDANLVVREAINRIKYLERLVKNNG